MAPVYSDLTSDPLLRLEVGADGIARGNADAELTVGFMHLRTQRPNAAALHEVPWGEGTASATVPDIWDPMHDPSWTWAVGLAVPSCRYNAYPPGERSPGRLVLFQDPITGSWASFHSPDGTEESEVRQDGPRRLADEVIAAIRWFARRGAPPLHAWQWEVGPDRQRVTLPLEPPCRDVLAGGDH